jgi:hypothetical protein
MLKNGITRIRVPRSVIFAIAGTMCALWLAYLLFQTGQPWDESEHAHVAWLMSQGKRPIDDFFQHHQPLLWDLLSIYYRVGLSGAEVLIWGRVIVVLCGLVSVWALLALGRSFADKRLPMGLVGIAAFIGLTLLLPHLFVSRPETLSTACMLAALALWHRDGKSPALHAVAAGILAGASCYASPRFVLLGAFFALLGNNTARRWILLVSGGVLFLSIYTLLSGFSIEKLLFNLKFSAYLQSVGDSAVGQAGDFWTLLGVAVVMPMLPLLTLLGPHDRLRGGLLVANLLAIFLMCNGIAGLFHYAQAYAPFITATPVVLTWLIARFSPMPSERSVAGILAAVFLLVVFSAALSSEFVRPQFRLLQIVHVKNVLASLVPAHRTVLFYADRHPITVLDASYYGSPLFDAQDRLCRAIRDFRGPIVLPPCGYLHDVQSAQPYMLDTRILRGVKIPEVRVLNRWIRKRYGRADLPDDVPAPVHDGVLIDSQSHSKSD